MKLYILILLLLVNTQAFAQTLASKWASNVYETIIYISFDITDQENGAVNSLVGTGFIISRDGYILTANHLFEDWHKQSDAQQEQNKIYGRIGGRDSTKSYPLEFIRDPDVVADVVLMKLRVSPPQEFQQLPLCFASSMSLGTEIVAYGFPMGEGIQATPGTIGNLNGRGGRYSVNSDFTHGMSGGPVFNQDGVIGIIKGGIDNEPAVRWVTPIKAAKNLAETVQGIHSCNSVSGSIERRIPSSSNARIIKNRVDRILDLKKEVVALLGDHKSINDDSNRLTDKIRTQAPKIAKKLESAIDNDIGIGYKITKYEYTSLAFRLAASYENNASELLMYIEKGIEAGRHALLLIDELEPVSDREYSEREIKYLEDVYDWVIDDSVKEGIRYDLAILYAIKAQKFSAKKLFLEIEKLLTGIPATYRNMYPLEKDSYLQWYLTEKNNNGG